MKPEDVTPENVRTRPSDIPAMPICSGCRGPWARANCGVCKRMWDTVPDHKKEEWYNYTVKREKEQSRIINIPPKNN